MGMGDEIIATGEARHIQEQEGPDAVAMLDFKGNPRWHQLWEGNPRIYDPRRSKEPPKRFIRHGPRCRPYIDYDAMRRDFNKVFPGKPWNPKVLTPELPYRYNQAKVKRGELWCIDKVPKAGYVVIEPHHKANQVNRDWGWHKWQVVVDALKLDWVQINPNGVRLLRGVRHLPGNDFPTACSLLSGAQLFVGPEGGLYHAAAALGIPSVAIFGGFVSPDNQGYDDCVNLYEPTGSPCGQRVRCEHCRTSLERIKPDQVIEGIERILAR